MPWGAVELIPGVNVEQTPTLNRAGISSGTLIRFRDKLVQKYGGWTLLYPFALSGIPRELHAWEDLNSVNHVGVGTTTGLFDISNNIAVNCTPQTKTTNITPDAATLGFTTTIGSATVTVTDTNINTVTTLDTIYLPNPVAVGGLILSGPYQIQTAGSPDANSYTITAASTATSNVTKGGFVPQYTTANGSSTITVTLTAHGLTVGQAFFAEVSTTANGVTIFGHYIVLTAPTANTFTIAAANTATAAGSFYMNSGTATNLIRIVYYLQIGPTSAVTGYGTGPYGQANYGTGGTISVQTGTPITATDWTSDNWGQIWLTNPTTGPVYQWDPTAGNVNAGVVPTAPFYNGGIFVSMAQQILICWASTMAYNMGFGQDPMLIKWSDSGDYTNFVPRTTNQAGSFRIPIGSAIKAGCAVSNQNLIWTDLDLWAMSYVGPPLVYGFNKIGAGAGAVSSHAVQQLRNGVYWMGQRNFYRYGVGGGVEVLQCQVWDAIFQNLNTSYLQNIRAMPNTPFNEVGWLYPSASSASGENDSYVKFNISEPGLPWDFGTVPALARSAWMDQSIVGTPVGATQGALVYQHESGNDAAGAAMNSTFTTGYFYLSEGEEFVVVDQIIPDFIFGTYAGAKGANIQISANVINFPGETPTVYGPFSVTSTSQKIDTRFRGRQASYTVQSNDSGSFWRLGRVRHRYAGSGRR